MKILVTAAGDSLESPVDPRFGRAAHYILIDSRTGEHEVVDNPASTAPQGAGIGAAQRVAELGAEYVLTGHCGPKAFRTLTAAGIKVVVGVEGTVGEAYQRFLEGGLSAAEEADVEGHW
ncbi:MAG: dinitrogenase iron-molybdenum cofactor biosynthesis protein [Candidatus Eisenbacteria bacterium]|nr:dinitrogenase iron-molybdenum cofactor biosynthesis protein [Candidatus Eisenbacteria bacterium]